MTLGDIIKEYRVPRKLSQDDIAERSGLSKAYISILERNYNPKTKLPPIPTIRTIFAVAGAVGSNFDSVFAKLDCDTQAAISDQNPILGSADQTITSAFAPLDLSNYHRIPIVSQNVAGLPLLAEENIEGYTLTDLNHGHTYFALRVHGDSMDAIGIREGYLIVVRQQEKVENGEIAVVQVGEEEATVKRFYRMGDSITLMPQSTNPIHQPQIYGPEISVTLLGKVVKVEFMI